MFLLYDTHNNRAVGRRRSLIGIVQLERAEIDAGRGKPGQYVFRRTDGREIDRDELLNARGALWQEGLR